MDGEAPAAAAAALRLAAVARRWLENPRDSLARSREEGCGDAFNTVVMPGFRVSLAEPGRLVCSFRVPAAVAVRASSFLSRRPCRSPRRVRSHSDSVSPACSWFLLLRRWRRRRRTRTGGGTPGRWRRRWTTCARRWCTRQTACTGSPSARPCPSSPRPRTAYGSSMDHHLHLALFSCESASRH